MLINYGDGRVLAGILMSLKGGQMRVAVKDADDIAEFRLINGLWISESCDSVTFEFPTAIFDAIGIVPDSQNLNPQPDLLCNRESTAAAAVDRPN